MTKNKNKGKENSLSKVLGNAPAKDIPSADLDFASLSPYSWNILSPGVRIKGAVVSNVLLIYEIETLSFNHLTDLLNRLEGFKYIMAMPIMKDNMSDMVSKGFNVVVFNDHKEREIFVGLSPDDTFDKLDEDTGLIQYQLGLWEA